jgi:hypothetical protein
MKLKSEVKKDTFIFGSTPARLGKTAGL